MSSHDGIHLPANMGVIQPEGFQCPVIYVLEGAKLKRVHLLGDQTPLERTNVLLAAIQQDAKRPIEPES